MILAVTDAVFVGLIAAGVTLAGIVSPVIVGVIVSNSGRKMKQLDWDREDIVAERARVAALAAQETQIALVKASENQAANIKSVEGKVDIIHGLTNSALTASKKATLAALTGQLGVLEAFIASNPEMASKLPDLEALRVQVETLAAEVAERERNDEVAVEKARQMSAEHGAAELQVAAAEGQRDAAVKQSEAADKQIQVASAQAAVAAAQAEANRAADPIQPPSDDPVGG